MPFIIKLKKNPLDLKYTYNREDIFDMKLVLGKWKNILGKQSSHQPEILWRPTSRHKNLSSTLRDGSKFMGAIDRGRRFCLKK